MERSVDRAMRIVSADAEDSALAIRSLFRIATLKSAASSRESHHSTSTQVVPLSNDRRMHQLTECVLLRLPSLSTEDLVVCLWSLASVRLDNFDYVHQIIKEFDQRLSASETAVRNDTMSNATQSTVIEREDLAAITWTLGCVKEAYDHVDTALMDRLLLHYASRELCFTNMNQRLVVRFLWSAAVYGEITTTNHRPLLASGLETSLSNITSLSVTNLVSLLWCSSRWDQTALTLPLLSSLTAAVNERKLSIASTKLAYLLEAVQRINRSTRRRFIATEQQDQQQREESKAILLSLEQLLSSILAAAIVELSSLSWSQITTVMQATVAVEFPSLTGRVQRRLFLSAVQIRVSSDLDHAQLTAVEAAGILEAVAGVVEFPHLLRDDARSSLRGDVSDDLQQQKQLASEEEVVEQWHELSGRVAIFLSDSGNKQVLLSEPSRLIAAAWSLARLGHSHRPLLHLLRKHGEGWVGSMSSGPLLSALSTARMAVALAAEQVAALGDDNQHAILRPVPPAALVQAMATRLLHPVGGELKVLVTLPEQAQAVFSLALLLSLVPASTNITHSTNDNSTIAVHQVEVNGSLISIAKEQLQHLSTAEIVGLHWALTQLQLPQQPYGQIVDKMTFEAIRMDLLRRFPALPEAEEDEQGSDEKDVLEVDSVSEEQTQSEQQPVKQSQQINAEQPPGPEMKLRDSFLLVRSLRESAGVSDQTVEQLRTQACRALLSTCSSFFSSNEAEEEEAVVDSEGKKGEELLSRAQIIADSLQAFIDLRWFDSEMVIAAQRAILALEHALEPTLESVRDLPQTLRRKLRFVTGQLKQLLTGYERLSSTTNKTQGDRQQQQKKHVKFPRLRGLLKRFFRSEEEMWEEDDNNT